MHGGKKTCGWEFVANVLTKVFLQLLRPLRSVSGKKSTITPLSCAILDYEDSNEKMVASIAGAFPILLPPETSHPSLMGSTNTKLAEGLIATIRSSSKTGD